MGFRRRAWWYAGLAAVLATAFAGAATTPPRVPDAIRGRVARRDGKPVARAVVRLVADDAADAKVVLVETRDDGSFSAAGFPTPTFSLRAYAGGFAPFTQEKIPAGASVRVVLEQGAARGGVVLALPSRAPVAGATVVGCDRGAARFGEDACARTTSGADGRFVLVDLPRGDVVVEARAKGYAAAKSIAGSSAIELLLAPGGRLGGRVVGADGKPVPGARVIAHPWDVGSDEMPPADATSDLAGAFALDGLRKARYRLTVAKSGYLETEAGPFPVAPGTDAPAVEIRLGLAATLTLRLLDPASKPLHGLTLEVEREAASDGGGARPTSETVPSDRISEQDGGRYTIVGMAPGSFTVRILPEEFPAVERKGVRLEGGATTDLGTITVRGGRTLSGLVTDASGAPVRAADVAAAWYEGKELRTRHATTTAQGRYRIENIGTSRIELVLVRARGFVAAERRGAVPRDGVLDVVLERRGAIVGKVQAAGGAAAPPFEVHVTRETLGDEVEAADPGGDEGRGRVSVDTAGGFRVDDLDPGTYVLEIAAQRRAPVRSAPVIVVADQTADVGTILLASGGVLRGRVLDGRDETPVQGATIRVEVAGSTALPVGASIPAASAAVSAGDGAFTLDGLDPGAFLLEVEHPVFSPARIRVVLRPDEDAPEVVVRLSRGGTLTGLVLDGGRQPVPDDTILALPVGATENPSTGVTGADGRYTIASLLPGTYQVTRQRGSGAPPTPADTKAVVIRDGEITVLDFDESPSVTLSGRILRGETPLPNLTVLLVPVDATTTPADYRSATSDAGAVYRVQLDHGGNYQVSVRTADAAGAGGQSTIRLTVPDQPEVQQDIVFPLTAILGRVTSRDGQPIDKAIVTAVRTGSGPDDPARMSAAQSIADGTFRVEAVDPGTYRVTARARGYRAAEMHPVIVGDDAPAPTVDLSLERGWLVNGRLVDPEGRGISGAMIVAALPGTAQSGMLPSNSGPDGAFTITSPVDGPVGLTAIAPGWAPTVVREIAPPTGEDAPPVVLQATPGGVLRIRAVTPEGVPVAGVQLVYAPQPLFAGCDVAVNQHRPAPTDGEGVSILRLLAPGSYLLSAPGRSDIRPVPVTVREGEEVEALVTIGL